MVSSQELGTNAHNTWCPGCGNFTMLAALKNSISQLNLNQKDVVLVSGIGCSCSLPHYINAYGFHTIHGRALPVAEAIKLVNNSLTVVASGGDGDGYGIGVGHFIHAMKRNIDMTYVVHDNQIYSLTKGQTSPTSEKGMKTVSTPFGNPEEPLNPIAIAIASGATFVARGFAGDVNGLTELYKQAIQHKGFALIDVLQPCITLNKINTFKYYKDNIQPLPAEHDPTNKQQAFKMATEVFENGKFPIGVFYKENKPIYEESVSTIKETPLVKQPVGKVSIERAMKAFF